MTVSILSFLRFWNFEFEFEREKERAERDLIEREYLTFCIVLLLFIVHREYIGSEVQVCRERERESVEIDIET